ncbi:MAG: UvrD-helicase domain-containing protein [Mycolicibacterium cosmeticum]|nr:UvrD-helicase domain-containing protein [Mycolicibacterium cosmeticum]
MSFSLSDDLPTGTTVIEASAGTGKTYAIVGLAARYVAEGIPLSAIMLVTFGRSATQELRDRARARLRNSADALADPATARASLDVVISTLATGTDAEVDARRRNLLRAVSDFDSATIATTHSFCQRMLDGIGFVGDYEPNAEYRENMADLLKQVSDDLYTIGHTAAFPTSMTLRDAKAVAGAAADDPQATLFPEDADDGSVAAQRLSFAVAARSELLLRKRSAGLRDFNDMLVLLRDALADPHFGATAAARIRKRYQVVLVDEFQDTDPLQWEILRRAFGGHVTLILVGDPKQAIYAFRGADVQTYLSAVSDAGKPAQLVVNRRSDDGLLRALGHLYGGAALGDDAIIVGPIESFHKESRVDGSPFRLRYLTRDGSSLPPVGRIRKTIARDVAADIVDLLNSNASFVDEDGRRLLIPSDIAVLVRTREHGTLINAALNRASVPCVLTGGSSVFTTEAASAWQRLLSALEQPHRATSVKWAALSPLLGYTATDLAAGGDALTAQLSSRIREWAHLFTDQGLASMFEVIAADRILTGSLLRIEGGSRLLTDLRHLAQVLNRVAADEGMGLSALSRWLQQRIDDAAFAASEDRSRLLDRGDAAVRIVTVHMSKGLEFPVVYLPYCWDRSKRDKPETLLLHEGGVRVRDVGGPTGPGYDTRKTIHDDEESGEDLRLMYVAATRAKCRVTAWWAPTRNTKSSALHRLLFGRSDGTLHPEDAPAIPVDGVLPDQLRDWATSAADVISIEPALDRPVQAWTPERPTPGEPVAADFHRQLNWAWRRTSYTALTRTADGRHGTFSEPEQTGIDDEPSDDTNVSAESSVGNSPSLMNDLGGGAAFGTLVHKILQRIDTDAADLEQEVRHRCMQVAAGRLTGADIDTLAYALTATLRTPLPEGSLADIGSQDRLVELDFELPLSGGELSTGGSATTAAIADLVAAHLDPTDPLSGYADILRTLPNHSLQGYLNGSIDAVLRYPGPRFVVVDYKTNRLFPGPVDAAQFDQASMAAEMIKAHYPLQALLYSVALHRYLRWRRADYDPKKHLGGVLYLFLRGMIGSATPPGCGVFSWNPPAPLVTGLSDLLAAR